jgi:metal-sulfur cluster biosynthetic enzyme
MSEPIEAEIVWEQLRTIPDPEFGVSIVDLGLIYSVACENGSVRVVMTLTTPTCPSGAWIHEGVQAALHRLPGVGHVEVAVVFDPPWTPDMLSETARQQLGWTPASRDERAL